MNPIPELIPLLKQLRLSGILDSLEARNREAIDRKLAYTDFLSLLVQDEVPGAPTSVALPQAFASSSIGMVFINECALPDCLPCRFFPADIYPGRRAGACRRCLDRPRCLHL
jgi:hypothetical protein